MFRKKLSQPKMYYSDDVDEYGIPVGEDPTPMPDPKPQPKPQNRQDEEDEDDGWGVDWSVPVTAGVSLGVPLLGGMTYGMLSKQRAGNLIDLPNRTQEDHDLYKFLEQANAQDQEGIGWGGGDSSKDYVQGYMSPFVSKDKRVADQLTIQRPLKETSDILAANPNAPIEYRERNLRNWYKGATKPSFDAIKKEFFESDQGVQTDAGMRKVPNFNINTEPIYTKHDNKIYLKGGRALSDMEKENVDAQKTLWNQYYNNQVKPMVDFAYQHPDDFDYDAKRNGFGVTPDNKNKFWNEKRTFHVPGKGATELDRSQVASFLNAKYGLTAGHKIDQSSPVLKKMFEHHHKIHHTDLNDASIKVPEFIQKAFSPFQNVSDKGFSMDELTKMGKNKQAFIDTANSFKDFVPSYDRFIYDSLPKTEFGSLLPPQ